MKVEIKGKELVITVPFDKDGTVSDSEKSLIHYSSKGNFKTEVAHNGSKLIVGLNVYTPNPKYDKSRDKKK